jgi:hypothetical protein
MAEVYDIDYERNKKPAFQLAGVSDDWLRGICEWGAGNPRIDAIYLFGSRAFGCYRPESDIDLALLINGTESDTAGGYWVCMADAIRAELGNLCRCQSMSFRSAGRKMSK